MVRAATFVHSLRKSADVVLVANGAFTAGSTRQEQLKLETATQILGNLHVAAVNLAIEDANGGAGYAQTIQNLTDRKLTSGSLMPSALAPFNSVQIENGIAVLGASTHADAMAQRFSTRSVGIEEVIASLIDAAKGAEAVPVLLLDGTKADAEYLAKAHPELALIAYRSASDPPSAATYVGQTAIVSPGEWGKYAVSLSLVGGRFDSYQSTALDPNFADDPTALRFFQNYLTEVDREGLMAKAPRFKSFPFAGSEACAKCHAGAFSSWHHSAHSRALQSLVKVGESRDPECVKCHVTGFEVTSGFRSVQATPGLANVSCESCHGSGVLHGKSPKKVRLPKVDQKQCIKCHTVDQSPNFIFRDYWAKILHR
jgi:hypothetical protein